MSGLDIPATVDASEVTDVVRRRRRRGDRLRHRRRLRGGQRRGRRSPGPGAGDGPPWPAAPPRWPAGTSTSAAGPPCSRRPATATASRRCTSTSSRCPAEPELDKIRAYCEGSVEHFNWLEELGVAFERTYYPEKAVIQPNTEGLMFTGNEKVWPYKNMAVPAPRGHKVPVPGDTQGAAMVIDLLLKRAAELGVQIRYETGATNLVVDDGDVVGVSWKHFNETGAIRAKSVVIAAGGFVMNPDMVAEFTPKLAEKPFVLGNTYDDGLGIRLGESVGGATKHMDQVFITAPVYPPSNPADRHHRQQARQAVRRRGLLPFAHFGFRDGPARQRGVPDRRRGAHAAPEIPLITFIDGWETVEEMETALGIPRATSSRR